MKKNDLIIFWVLLVTFTATIGCDSKPQPEVGVSKEPAIDCSPPSLNELIGKSEKEIPPCFVREGAALVGKSNKFVTQVLRNNDQLTLIFGRVLKDDDFIVLDVLPIQKLEKDDTILYGSCYVNFESGVVDAIAIAKYKKEQRFMLPKKSWLIDFEAGKIKPNEVKITCVNESYGS